MKKIFLYPNFTKEGTQDAAEQIVRRLVELDMEVWCDRETMEKLPLQRRRRLPVSGLPPVPGRMSGRAGHRRRRQYPAVGAGRRPA